MTDPHDRPDQEQPDSGAARPGGAARPEGPAHPTSADLAPAADHDAAQEAAVQRVRQLLRDEPVDDDELARERRLRVALATATPGARRAAPRRWLTAAAIVAVMGVGGYFLVTVGTGVSDENASNDAATVTDDFSGADGGAGAADTESDSAGRVLSEETATTTVPGAPQDPDAAPSALGFDASVVDLGSVASLEAAIVAAEALRATPDDAADRRLRRVPEGQALRCIDQQRALGLEVVALATLERRELVVVRSPAGPLALDAAICAPAGP